MTGISSRLWKSAALSTSTYFPQMVRTAAVQGGVPYNDALLAHVAADPALLEAVDMPAGEGADAVIAQLVKDPVRAVELDDLIVAAVGGYIQEGV